jgi:RNA recognition motif-containing protein
VKFSLRTCSRTRKEGPREWGIDSICCQRILRLEFTFDQIINLFVISIVEFTSEEDAQKALDKLQGIDFDGRSISLKFDQFADRAGGGPVRRERRDDDYGRDGRSGGRDYRRDERRGDYRDDYRDHYRGGRRDDRYGGDDYGRGRGRRSSYSRSRTRSRSRNYRSRERGGDRYGGGRESGGGGGRDRGGYKLFVANLPWRTDWRDLKDYFKKAGRVAHADVLTDQESGRSKGCGVVSFEDKRDAENAISKFCFSCSLPLQIIIINSNYHILFCKTNVEMLDGTEFEGRKIEVRMDKYN